MNRNRSLNTTNGLLAKMESSYATTCFGAYLPDRTPVQPTPTTFHRPNLLPTIGQKGNTYYNISPSQDSHTLRSNRPAPFFHPPEQTRAAIYTQHYIH